MTKDQIINEWVKWHDPFSPVLFAMHVADMAIAKEREACAQVCDEMVDWPIDRHPGATIMDSHQYLSGIKRGLVNATNAIRKRV